MPASWMRIASRSIPLSLLRQATGSQKKRAAPTSVTLALDASAACMRAIGEAPGSRQLTAVEAARTTVAAAMRKIRAVNASRKVTLSYRGPPGRNKAPLTTADTLASN